MAAIRLIPLKQMAGVSLLGAMLIRLLHLYDNKTQSLVVFFALLVAQVSIYSAYAMFVYPYFVSPLRHLPQVKGGLPLFGHGISMRKNGPGVMAKKWQVMR